MRVMVARQKYQGERLSRSSPAESSYCGNSTSRTTEFSFRPSSEHLLQYLAGLNIGHVSQSLYEMRLLPSPMDVSDPLQFSYLVSQPLTMPDYHLDRMAWKN
ncbi:hypothetical protein LINGRAHAP2_LOCUS34636 [Linum grandiflorum]